MNSAVKGPEDLKKEVLDRNLCSSCGLCVGMCPYIKTVRDRAVMIHPCGLKEGNCYRVCPRTGVDARVMDNAVFGSERSDQALGFNRGVYFARALSPEKARAGQYGGVVTALTAFALEQGIISGAVMAGGSPSSPEPFLAKNEAGVTSCAGSKYTAVPTLTSLNRAARDGMENLGVVGRPCQVTAVRKGQQIGRENPGSLTFAGSAGLVIGLFCFWSLNPDFYGFLREKSGGSAIQRVDIPIEGLTLTTAGGTATWPVDEIRPYIREACQSCIDCTSEWADLSVGSTEYDPAWNTLVVRSGAGQSLVNDAVEKGIIEIKSYPEERLPILRKAVLNKKMRVLEGSGGPGAGYITVGDYAGEVKKQWEVLQ